MNYEQWVKKYKPIQNRLVEDAAFDGTMFETYDKELDYVKQQNYYYVWTYVSSQGDYIIPGKHLVNRIGYFITKEPWVDETIQITL